ncbi:MAG: hypothetical protein QOK35_384 [Pseudonocardiales bacterium]|nr:hypothetical protein [Pseudonocardiales bacterium]
MSGLPTRAFLQTRGAGRAGDYTFLGSAPDETWWRAYRDTTAFDHPTVLLTSDGGRWAAYLSGVPSARVDAVGTVVRYTLVLDGPCGAAETDCVVAGVAAWLDDVAAGADGPRGRLSVALDERFPADLVDRMIATPFPGGAGSGPGGRGVGLSDLAPRFCTDATLVGSRVMEALRALPGAPHAVDSAGGGAGTPGGARDWLGTVADPTARAAFVARVRRLLAGTPGRALLLNLVGSPGDAAALLDPASPVVVLVDGPTPARMAPLRSEVDAKKALPAPALARRAGVAAVVGTAALPVMAAAVILAALLLTVLVLLL